MSSRAQKKFLHRLGTVPVVLQTQIERLEADEAKLARSVSSRTIVYLDINHWINLYEVGRGRSPTQDEYAMILAALERLVASGRVCCPVSSAVLNELMKQEPESRAGTASLMDQLSGHVCIQYSQNLARREWRHNVRRVVLGGDVKPAFPVWTMAGFWSGQQDWLHEPSRWMRRRDSEPARWLERRWSMGFRDVIAEPGVRPLPDPLVAAHVAEIENNRLRAIAEGMSFAKLLWHTKCGLIESWKETFFREPPPDVRELPTTIFSSFIDESDPWVLPTLQVYARLATALTLSNKRLVPNDTLDLWHAQYAVPHCHVFFCDKFVAQTCNTEPLSLGKLYGTTILSRVAEILTYLNGLEKPD